MDIVTAITGASGALYAQRFITGLVAAGVRVHLVISPLGEEFRLEVPAVGGFGVLLLLRESAYPTGV